ncbi:MAG: DUF1906 domain-containing protein [Acetobacteraceae bacterium]|nr:DUF1906 domain-containing protein [Acetobacteraceae bacterium]
MSGAKPELPQDVTFTNITSALAASLRATYTNSAAIDGVAVSFSEQPGDRGTVTLSVHFSQLVAGAALTPMPGAAGDASSAPPTMPQASPATPSEAALVGFDATQDCGNLAPRLRSAKVDFVIRYYSHSAWKNLTASEARLLSNSGIKLVTVWESAGDHISFFTRLQGVDDATSAYNMAVQVGQPAGTPIYFAVDCDPVQNDLNSAVVPYFQGVAAGFSAIGHGNPAYTAGVYGSGLVCGSLARMGLVTHTWLANAMGWQGSRTYKDWDIRQHLPSDPYGLGFKVDPDDAKPAFGGFLVAPPVA